MESKDALVIPKTGSKPIRKKAMRGDHKKDGHPALATSEQTEEIADRKAYCVEMLVEGFAQSYVDLFYLSHRPDPTLDANGKVTGKDIQLPIHVMDHLRVNLSRAEAARREGNTTIVFDSYNNIAKYFQDHDDPTTAVFFLEKCLEIAQLTMEKKDEMHALHHLGTMQCRNGNYTKAIEYHEKQLRLATSMESTKDATEANLQLIVVYHALADNYQADNKIHDAILLYEKCFKAAKQANNKEQLGRAEFQLGKAYAKLNQSKDAIPHFEHYLTICKEMGNIDGEGEACSALAAALKSNEQVDEAIKYLHRYLEIAMTTENLTAQTEACCSLGLIYNECQDFPNAVKMFEKNYKIARSIVQMAIDKRSILDTARIYLGMARANESMGPYMDVINISLPKLLDWKIQRTKLTK